MATHGLGEDDADLLTGERATAALFEAAVTAGGSGRGGRLIINELRAWSATARGDDCPSAAPIWAPWWRWSRTARSRQRGQGLLARLADRAAARPPS